MGGKARRLRRVRKPALLLLAFVATALLLEGGLWLAQTVIGGKPRLLVADRELGWTHRRGFAGTRTLGDGRAWDLRLDERGRRDPGFVPRGPAPTLVALGDSFVFGDGVDTADQFLHRVARDLPARVVNLAVVGYSTDQELLAFRRSEERPDVVLLGSYLSNDLHGNLSHSGGALLRFKPKFVGPPGDLRLAPSPHPWLNAARHRSRSVTVALAAVHRIAPRASLFDPVPAEADGWERYVTLVDRIVEEAERREAARVLILLWTARSAGLAPHAAPALTARYAGRPVTLVDLDATIAGRGLDPAPLYHPPRVDRGGHWTAAGHALVAELVLAALTDGDQSSNVSAISSSTASSSPARVDSGARSAIRPAAVSR